MQWAVLAAAVSYLSQEVPAWKANNGCYSCHNNGDAFRALLAARRAGYRVPERALADTVRWLTQPAAWDKQQADAAYRDKNLARIQFSLALADVNDRAALRLAADSLVKLQSADGSWPLEQDAAAGSPATYGTPLSTYAALRVLRVASSARTKEAIQRAEAWLRRLRPVATVDVAAVVMGVGAVDGVQALLKSQTRNGGWGPYPNSPVEAFDTAIAMLALADHAAAKKAVERGAEWLGRAQLASGGWPATTRPSGGVSYAQHVSTTGWAVLALIKARSGTATGASSQ